MKTDRILALPLLLIVGSVCAASSVAPGGAHAGGVQAGGLSAADFAHHASSWKDPYPDLPAANDPAIVEAGCGTRGSGEFIGPSGIRYRIIAPLSQDTSDLALLVQNDADDCGMGDADFVTINIAYPLEGRDSESYVSFIDSKSYGPDCSPHCSMFKLLGAIGLKDLLLDAATRVRFDHKRVFMIGAGQCTYPVTFALETDLQPFFAGVVCEAYTEWQMSACPSVSAANRTPLSPRIFFSVGGCDHSFCPQMACYESAKAGGYDVTIRQETTYKACPCNSFDFAMRPHILDGSDRLNDAASWMNATSR